MKNMATRPGKLKQAVRVLFPRRQPKHKQAEINVNPKDVFDLNEMNRRAARND